MPKRRGFSLIELLVVIAIIAVLVALLVAAIQRVREAAARAQCVNNLRQIGLAALDYESVNHAYPPAWKSLPVPDATTPPSTASVGVSVFALLLPFLEQEAVSSQIDMSKGALSLANMSPANQAYASAVAVFLCPSSPGDPSVDYSTALDLSFANFNYNDVNYTPGCVFGRIDYAPTCGTQLGTENDGSPAYPATISLPPVALTRVADVSDGTSNTLMFAESAGRPSFYGNLGLISSSPTTPQGGGAWADPLGYVLSNGSVTDGSGQQPGDCAANCSNNGEIYAFHTGGFNAVFGDGSVHFVRDTLTMTQLSALVSIAGSELIDFDYE